MNVKRDDAFISWLDGHEYTIVYCMSLRVAIERKNAAIAIILNRLIIQLMIHAKQSFFFLFRLNHFRSKMSDN